MVKKIRILFIILSIFISTVCYAQNHYEEVVIGTVEIGEEVFIYNQCSYPLFKVRNQLYLPLSSLQDMGLCVNDNHGIIYIRLNGAAADTNLCSTVSLEEGKATMCKSPVYVGNIRSFSLQTNNEILIPLDALKAIWQIKNEENAYWQEDNLFNEMQLIEVDEEGILNNTDHLMILECVHLYWTGQDYDSIQEKIVLEANEKKTWLLDSKQLYITTLITQINELPIKEANEGAYGQKNLDTFKQYSDAVRFEQLSKVFPSCVILGQMKYNAGPFKAKEVVELCRSEKNAYLLVKDNHGNKYQVPYNSLHILGEKGARISKVANKDIEDFVRLSEVQSATDYLLWTDLYRQRTYVLKKVQNGWTLEKSFVCSTGKAHNPTPPGLYEVQYMIPYIGVEKGYRCKYALVFFRDYMYHSILFDKSGKYIKSGQYELGSKASHGCVRLSEKDSQWLYQHVPVKSTVWIR